MDHPLLNAFLMIMWFFIFVLWLMLLFRIIGDLFTDKGLSGWAKAAWLIFLILVPYLGVLVYLIARGHSMNQRAIKHAAEAQQQFDDYVRKTAATPGDSAAEQLSKLAALKDAGTISDAEFQQAKTKILAA